MANGTVLKKIEVAERELSDAQGALDTLLQTMTVASRADKTPVTQVVADAFDRIRTAQAVLLELRELIVGRGE